MSNIEWILIIITIFLVILLFRYIQLKKQIRNLADQVNELNSGNSQQMLDISLIDKDLERLAGILNQYNIRQRQAVAGVLRNEEYLKNLLLIYHMICVHLLQSFLVIYNYCKKKIWNPVKHSV